MLSVIRFYFKIINYRGKNLIYLFVQFVLYLLSGLYYLILKIIRTYRFGRKIKIDIPIISVGNIVWGGTGKTPVVIYLAEKIKDYGKKVAIVHHGSKFSDEAESLKVRLPEVEIFHSISKKEAVLKVGKRKDISAVIIDDGFQNWGIYRDLDIVVMDCNVPFGNGYLIPRGNLREEPASIARADLIVINKITTGKNLDQVESQIKKYNSWGEIVYCCYEIEKIMAINNTQTLPPSVLSGKKVALITAIAQPDYFEHIVKNRGVHIVHKFFYPDHYIYTHQDIKNISKELDDRIEFFLTTEKDREKFKRIFSFWEKIISLPLYVVGVNLKVIKNEQTLDRRLHFLLDNPGF